MNSKRTIDRHYEEERHPRWPRCSMGKTLRRGYATARRKGIERARALIGLGDIVIHSNKLSFFY